MAREAAITKQLIETPKEERPLSRISRWDLYDYIQGVFLTVPPDFSYQHEKKVIQGGDIDVLVSDTLGTQESRIGPEISQHLDHPSGDS